MQHSSKQVDSCVKMFALLKLLLEDNANFAKVVSVISDNEDSLSCDNSIHSVTLNKYFNTLKLIGLNVKKEKGKYHIENPPYKINFTQEDIKAFELLKECAYNLNSDEKEELNKIFKAFSQGEISKDLKPKTKFYKEQTTEQINICTKFCAEDYKVEINYYTTENAKKKITAKADKLLYRNENVFLQILNLQKREPNVIPLDKIISIKQLPTKINSRYKTNRVTVYGLRGRLAKNYRLRPWEYVDRIENGWLIIINKDESDEELTQRILKYGDLCKVITPKEYKEKIRDIFNKTLELYDN